MSKSKQHQRYKYLCNRKEHTRHFCCLPWLLHAQLYIHDFMHFYLPVHSVWYHPPDLKNPKKNKKQKRREQLNLSFKSSPGCAVHSPFARLVYEPKPRGHEWNHRTTHKHRMAKRRWHTHMVFFFFKKKRLCTPDGNTRHNLLQQVEGTVSICGCLLLVVNWCLLS